MADHPIIFSASMIRALLDGRKSMTRRLAWRYTKPEPRFPEGTARATTWQSVKPGDRLWCRENLCAMRNWGLWHDAGPMPKQGQFLDDLDERGRAILDWYGPTEATDSARVPSIHMPRWASRLTLVVTATKIERVQEISEEDAIAEGMTFRDHGMNQYRQQHCGWNADPSEAARGHDYCLGSARHAFGNLWEKLHGPGSWNANPEVVVLTFTVHKTNIDAMAKAA